VWIRKEGLYTDGARVTFEELREMICEIARVAGKTARGEVPRQTASS
jgi:hypothetical protein